MLDREADIEAKDFAERTPLHMAASSGHGATTGLLLDRRADIEAKDSVNQTPLYGA